MDEKHSELSVGRAAKWYARLRAPDCAESERAAFEKWHSSNIENAKAYAVAERVATQIATNARFTALAEQALNEPSTGISRTFTGTHWRVAAALLIGVFVASFAAKQFTGSLAGTAAEVMHNNPSKQQQRLLLDDGTVVHLDAGSRIVVRMNKSERDVELLTGRAYFDVVHDASRPFYVNAGNMRTMDVGTRFQVALADGAASVTLVEGSVAVTDKNPDNKWRETLLPGEELLLNVKTGSLSKRNVDTLIATSWSQGRLVFKDTPLSEVLDEVNRYSESKIHLGDDSLGTTRIGGSFIAGEDSTEIVDALTAVLPLRVVHVGPNEIVLFQRYEIEIP